MATVVQSSRVTRLTGPYLNEDVGRRITNRTLRHLEEFERDHPGSVSSLLVFFEQPLDSEERQFMLTAASNQENREERYAIATRSTRSSQGAARDWLYRHAMHDYFTDCRDFDFVPSRDVRTFPALNIMSLPATRTLADQLSRQPFVLAIDYNFPVSPLEDDERTSANQLLPLATNGTSAQHCDGCTWGWRRLGLPDIHGSGFRGDGVCLGIANTGVCDQPADLARKIKDFAKVHAPNVVQPAHSFDDHWHGTHMAGTMIGSDHSGVQIGGAPDAVLKAVSVLQGNKGWASGLIAAMDWLADPFRSVNVLNISLGIINPTRDRIVELEEVILRLGQMDLLCVAAAGNRAGNALYPAALTDVIACGAIGPDDSLWVNSADADLVAPGQYVYSCFPPGHPDLHGQHYGWLTGTSAAAAHVTALLGLLIQACPSAGPKRLLESLLSTASDAERHRARSGFGIPDFSRAAEHIDAHLDAAP